MSHNEFFPLSSKLALGLAPLMLLPAGCSTPPPEETVNPPRVINSNLIGELGNVAGACVFDGANLYESFPMPTKDGKPSNTAFGNILFSIDLDGIKENGLQAEGAVRSTMAEGAGKYACFDIAGGTVTFVKTDVSDKDVKRGVPNPRFWFAIAAEDLKRAPALTSVASTLEAKKISYVVLSSDSTVISGKLSTNNGNATVTMPKKN